MTWLLRIALLTAVYALMLASAHPLDLATGALLSIAVTLALDRRRRDERPNAPSLASRLAASPLFVAGLVSDVACGTWDVALRVLHLRALDRPGIVTIPIGDRSRTGVAVSALASTLSPGSVLVDIDWARGQMLMHVVDASDPDAVRAHHLHFYERYQRRVFP